MSQKDNVLASINGPSWTLTDLVYVQAISYCSDPWTLPLIIFPRLILRRPKLMPNIKWFLLLIFENVNKKWIKIVIGSFKKPILAWGQEVIISALTHLSLDKMAAILQTVFSDAFSWMKIFIFWSEFHWSLFLAVQLAITQHLVSIMAWRLKGDKPLFEPKLTRFTDVYMRH